MISKKRLRSLLFASVLSAGAYAQTDSTAVDIFDMDFSLEDLLNMEVQVASKKAEKISDAPGMITSYSANDVERYGYYTLKDLANITSGYSTFSAFGETNVETRGQKAGSWNVSKHLLLIDGIPVNHSRANSAPMEYQIPVYFAERVEFLKGPGSALYGNSAFYGVMNVTSKDLSEVGSMAETKFTYGDAGNSTRVMGNAITRNEVGQLNLSFSYFKKGFSGDSLGAINGIEHFNNDNSIFLNSSFKFTDTKLKGLGVGLIYMRRNSHAGEFWGATPSPVNEQTWEEVIPYVKYQTAFSDKLNFNSYFKFNGSTEKSTFGASWNSVNVNAQPFAGYDYLTANLEGLAELNYEINDHSNIITGINIDSRKELGTPYSFNWDITQTDTATGAPFTYNKTNYDGTVRVNIASVYAQYRNEFNVLKGLILTAGGRLDNGISEAGTYSQFSPRAGLVQRLTNHLNVKALYGQALRAPGVKEIGLNAETISSIEDNGGTGNSNDIPSVGAEVIKSFEAGVNYNKGGVSLAGTYFYNTTTNALDGAQYQYIDRDNNSLSANYFANATGQINASGFEIDAQYAFSKNFRVMVNHAYAKAIQNDTIDFVDVPTQKTNAAFTVVLPGKYKMALTTVMRSVWGFTVAEGAYDAVSMNSPTEVAGFTLFDLNLQIPVNENLGFEIQARNLTDTQWKQPSLLGQNSMVPIARRNFMFTLYGRF